MKTHRSSSREAFTRLELLAVLCGIGMLSMVMASALANADPASERAVCANNLRLIGRAVQTWVGDSSVQRTPWWTRLQDGGTFFTQKPASAWYEFSAITNYLLRPHVIACPADTGVLPAKDWNEFLLSRQNSVSYTINLHAGKIPDESAWLSSDKNLRADGTEQCASGVVSAYRFLNLAGSTLGWTNAVHGQSGHVLLYGGSVEFTETTRLRQLLLRTDLDEAGTTHFLRAR